MYVLLRLSLVVLKLGCLFSVRLFADLRDEVMLSLKNMFALSRHCGTVQGKVGCMGCVKNTSHPKGEPESMSTYYQSLYAGCQRKTDQ